jgi:uncharacterized damage-inducible protein DinB
MFDVERMANIDRLAEESAKRRPESVMAEGFAARLHRGSSLACEGLVSCRLGKGAYSMNRVAAWFERKFSFTFPIEQFPNICIRLRGTSARLEEMTRSVSGDAMIRKPDNKWSAQEHAGHLADLEPLWLARVDDFLKDGSTLTVADLNNRKTHEANHNARELKQILADFRARRERLLDRVETLPQSSVARSLLHPRLQQPMRLVDHLYFVAEHDDHHLAAIWEMIHA